MKFFLQTTFYSLIGVFAHAQADSILMKGTLSIHKGSTYRYDLVIGSGKERWVGYSVLDKGGPNETRSSVVVTFNKAKASMLFAEKTLLYSKVASSDFCFVGGLLKYEEKKGKAKGMFLGRDQNNKVCGTGTVSFTIPESIRDLLTPDGLPDTNTVNMVLTRLNEERFKVKNSTVQLQLWDGGVEDQDSLTILLNDEVVEAAFEITKEKKLLTLPLRKGKNTVKIRALNEGTEAPNSARITVIDGDRKYSLISFLKKGEEAKVTVEY